LPISKYQEKGVGFNRGVAVRKVDKTTGLLGIKVSKAIELDSYLIIPENTRKIYEYTYFQ